MPIIIPIGFEAGINNQSSILLNENEMQECKGLVYDKKGILKCRPTRTKVNASAVGSIHTLHRYLNWLSCGDGYNLRYKWDMDGYCDRYTPPNENFTSLDTLESNTRLSVAGYANWMFFVNGMDYKAMTKGNLYTWGIDNPAHAPSGTAGAAGNPDGTYYLYYTFYIKFPNGEVYETGPSPLGSVTVSDQAVNWSGIQSCPYTGTGITIWRKLYRSVSSVVYYVHTLKDNTTSTYVDDDTDATLQANDSIASTYYSPPPLGLTQIEQYLERIWGIAGNTLYPSEAYLPFCFNPLRSIAVTDEDEELKAIKKWGDQLYIASIPTWRRLQGTDPDTWGIKRTFADAGIINGHTARVTKFGILGLWYDGIYAFDGSVSRNITRAKIGKTLFEDTISSYDACYAEWDGERYYFYYPTSGTTLSNCLVIDFTAYPELRFYHDDFIATAHQFHLESNIKYLGKSDGYQYEEAGSAETIATEIRSYGGHGGNVFQKKNIEYLWYDINTNSQDVTVAFYVDGALQSHTKTLNTSSRTRKRVGDFPQSMEGYWFDIKLTCSNSSSLEIYSPWALITNEATE